MNLIFVVLDIRTADAGIPDHSFSMHAWDVFTRRFEEGAARFRERHGTIPVLVIDNVNILASTPGSPDEATLRVIQATAKSWADKSIAKVVLIASPGRTQQVLSGMVMTAQCFPVNVCSACDLIIFLFFVFEFVS